MKLIRIEVDSADLVDWLDEHIEIPWITSVLAEIELSRAIRAVAPEGLPTVFSVLAGLDRFKMDPVIRTTAAGLPRRGIAIARRGASGHTASTAAPLTALVTYHTRLSQAANALGIAVAASGRQP